MVDAPSRALLRKLSLAAGPPGAEDEVRAIVRETLADVGEIRYDRLGSILCEKRGGNDAPRVLLDGHLDEVALIVRSITEDGRLTLVPLGSWWPHVLLSQRVEVLTEHGKVPGVIGATPPHFLSPEDMQRVRRIDDLYVDVGASARVDVERLGVRVGSPIVPEADFREMAVPDVLCGKAFDDRVGVGLMCEALLALRGRDHPNTVIGVGAVQEEVGLRGAGTASELARPDVALVLEGTPADDFPGARERQAVLGRGPQLRLMDPTAIANRRLVRFAESVAEEVGIPLQLAVRATGGTDAAPIHLRGTGVPVVVIGVPARYIHSHAGMIHWQDYVQASRLVLELVLRLDRQVVETFTHFG